jgi:AcrR family transcriptional regulator
MARESKDTAQRILDASLGLFNAEGIENVSLRRVAAELGISQGNLTYHFKKRDDIVFALYLALVERLNAEIAEVAAADDTPLRHLTRLTRAVFEAFEAYRFLLVDLAQIMRRYPQIQRYHLELQVGRRVQILGMFARMSDDGLLQPERYPGQRELLFTHMSLLSDFFIAGAETIYNIPADARADRYMRMTTELLWHHLTPRGQAMLDEALRKEGRGSS